nr:hypothetical protein [uncultured Rhodoferax sp.]
MTTTNKSLHESETERLLENVLSNAIRRSQPKGRSEDRLERRWFAFGLLLLTPVCVSIASLAWVLSDPVSTGIWLCFAITLLLGGGFYLHKARNEANSPMKFESSRKLHRVQ